MIISHKLKVIFIKTNKTAGSSFEFALSKYCGPDDIYTEVSSKQNIRKSWNIPKHQNDITEGKKTYRSHTPASKIKRIVSQNIWRNYLKVSIIRCPYDATISSYYWRRSKKTLKLFTANRLISQKSLLDYNLLCINNRLVTDFLIRYEYLDEDIKKLETKIGCPGLLETFQNTKDKSNYRPSGKDIYTVYSKNPIARAIIDKVYGSMMHNELVERYYPMYKERLNQKVPKPGYFSAFVANLLLKYSCLRPFQKTKNKRN